MEKDTQMDLISVLFAAGGGALGAGIGALLSKRISNKNARAIAIVIPAVFFGQLANHLSENQNVRDIISPPSRMEKSSRTTMKALVDNPKLKGAISGMTRQQMHPYIQQLTRQGLRRLSFQELKTWNALRIKMARNSISMCSAFWTGVLNHEDLTQSLEKLRDQELDAWLRISATAAILELEQKPFAPPPDSAFQNGIEQIALKLQPEETERMNRTRAKGTDADSKEACWTLLKLLEGVELLPQPQQEIFLRSLAIQ
jgi:hypothetical protein